MEACQPEKNFQDHGTDGALEHTIQNLGVQYNTQVKKKNTEKEHFYIYYNNYIIKIPKIFSI